jgi:hypothetical protein
LSVPHANLNFSPRRLPALVLAGSVLFAACGRDNPAPQGAQTDSLLALDSARVRDSIRVATQKAMLRSDSITRESFAKDSVAREKARKARPPFKTRGMTDDSTPAPEPPRTSPKTAPAPTVESQVKALSPADLSVRGIDSLRAHVSSQVVVRIAKPVTHADSEALKNLPATKEGVYHARATVGDSARVCLRGATAGDFEVQSNFGECSTQPITRDNPPEWSWLVTPLRDGKRTLVVSVEALLVAAPSRKFQEFYPVAVQVGDSDGAWAKWLVGIGAIVSAVAAIAGMGLRRRRTSTSASMASAPTAQSGGKYDAFISHSTKNADSATAICRGLEEAGLRCWIAPRDIPPGAAYDESIVEALGACRTMVLVLSAQSNTSDEVKKEVRNAVNDRIPVLPFRIEPVDFSPALRYHLSAAQWIDGSPTPRREDIERLAASIRRETGSPPGA